jgi:SAM-dependent methyltransferase
VYRCPLPEVNRRDGSFDAITAWAVLEHVHDPMAYFSKAARLLRPGGVFVFLVTNFDSTSSRYLYREDIPRHLYFFDPRTVAAYLTETGLVLGEAHHDDTIFEMRATNWLFHALRRIFVRAPMAWQELPETRQSWLARTGREPSAANHLRFALAHPLVILDRLLLPAYEAWQRMTKSYGISTYVARKPAQP